MTNGAGAAAAAMMGLAAAMAGCGARGEAQTTTPAEEVTQARPPATSAADGGASATGGGARARPACAPERDAATPPRWWEGSAPPADGQAEVEASLASLAAALERYHVAHGQYPSVMEGITPAMDCCRQDFGQRGLCAPSASAFDAEIWCTLGFRPRGAHYFRYAYFGTVSNAIITATGDLDCDGTLLTYTIGAITKDGAPRVEIVAPAPDTD
jgi:hypothetical protein